MNTDVKTTILNLLGPINAVNSDESGQNPLLRKLKNCECNRNGEFAAIARQARVKYSNSDNTQPSENNSENCSPSNDLQENKGGEILAKLSQMIQKQQQQQKNGDTELADATPALSEIAAFVETQLVQLEDIQVSQLTETEILPVEQDNIQEIKDLLNSVQEVISGESFEEILPVNTDSTPDVMIPTVPVSAETAIPTPTETEVPVPLPAIENTNETPSDELTTEQTTVPKADLPTVPVSAENTSDTPRQPYVEAVSNQTSTQTGEPAQSVQANTGESPEIAVSAKNTNMGTEKAPAFGLNTITAEQAKPDVQPSTPVAQQTTALNAEQLAEMAQGGDSGAETDQDPLFQMTQQSGQALENDTKKVLSRNEFKVELQTMERMAGEETESSDTAAVSTINTTATASSVKASDNTNPNADIARQIQESVITSYRADSKQIVIRLDPPELGRVTIQFVEKSDGITGVLQVEQAQTRHEIERALPEIIQNLQNASVQVKKVEIIAANQQNYDMERDESAFSGQESGFGQQNAPHSGYHESLTNFDDFSGTEQSNIQITDKSINMLI